jgi:uncharacterized protein (TIRG00374 family)
VPEHPEPVVNAKRKRTTLSKALKRTLLLVVFLLIIIYGVVPRLGAVSEGLDRLANANPLLVLTAVALEAACLLAYTLMTRATLPAEPHIGLWTLFRIQLATKSVSNIMPGGSAAGGTLGYRLLTAAGVPGPAAGFSLGTVGIGSAVVLNLLLWIALVVSIPFNGISPAYLTAAIVGIVLLAAAAALVALLMRGADRADKVIRAIARKVPMVEEETASRFARQTTARLHDLAAQPELIRRSVIWATANWLLDAACLWVLLFSFGVPMNPINLIVAYGAVNVLAALPLTPGGLGVVETALPVSLAAFGVPGAVATIAVLSWRFLQYLLPIPIGGVAYVSLRVGRLGQAQRAQADADAAREPLAVERRVWDEVSGEFKAVGAEGTPPPTRTTDQPPPSPPSTSPDND